MPFTRTVATVIASASGNVAIDASSFFQWPHQVHPHSLERVADRVDVLLSILKTLFKITDAISKKDQVDSPFH
ncbi:hypothetical protein T01_9539 [Trichinella spiralis]|uniref:Uncharacterized protein n=1 Tax=Trichinella spiralis TaxID=6334 RepID=A0A0V1BK01_TRISP|nr:hypothetical protein T01_9539 [Trichinella spiralis]